MQNENKRPWLNESRSWIFFKDQITRESNIIYDSTDGNVFMLDCESARLSIWSQKWNTLIDVGVSGLLKEEITARKTGKIISSAEIRVFYKGIELEKMSVHKDAGIIEFIDIKRDLEGEYLNISRGGFTSKGKLFFEEQLYPGLLEAVRNVLKYLAVSTVQKNKVQREESNSKIFSQKIESIVKNKCSKVLELRKSSLDADKGELAKLRNEIVSLSVSVSILSYLSARDEWNIAETMDGTEYYEENEWLNLVDKIDKILSKPENEFILSDLAQMTKFFDIKVYGENQKIVVNKVNDSRLKLKFRFTQIFSPKSHWAVLQIRKDSFSTWTSYLILLGDNRSRESDEFQKIISFPHSASDCRQLEKWGERLCNVVELSDDEADSSQQFLMNWMLKNIPTVGLFCNKSGNVRVNILARRIYPSIFLNENFKCLILSRIMEKAEADGIQRFSTIVWQGRENLGCSQLPFKIFFVKRGYFSPCSFHKTIIPFEGNMLKKWKKIIDEPSKIEEKVISLINLIDIQNNILRLISGSNMDEKSPDLFSERDDKTRMSGLSVYISEFVFIQIEEMGFKPNCDLDELLKSIDKNLEWQDLYYKLRNISTVANFGKSLKSEVEKLKSQFKEDELFEYLCNSWAYLVFEQEKVFDIINAVKEDYDAYIKLNPSYHQKKEKIADYLVKEGPYKYSKRRMLQYIEAYEKELLELFHHMECQRVRQHIDKLFSNNMYLISMLNSKKQKNKRERLRKVINE